MGTPPAASALPPEPRAATRRRSRGAWGSRPYRHSDWRLIRGLSRFLLRQLAWRVLVRIESVEGLENVPPSGPAILVINHIAFVDPIVLLGVLQRQVVPMAKVEVYDYPVIGVFPRLYGVIPVHRGEFDRKALERALEVLEAGEIVLVAPEGTRSPAMQRGKEGLAFLAARTNVPIIPVAVEGTEGYPSVDPRRWARGGAKIRIGRPFRFRPLRGRLTRESLRQMTDEAMYQVAALLPARRRGVYGDLERASKDTIETVDGTRPAS